MQVTLTAGIDLGGTKIQAVVRDSGKVVGQGRAETPQQGPDAVVRVIVGLIELAAREAGSKPAALEGVGIGFPGVYEDATGDVISAVNLRGFDKRYPMGARVSKLLGGVPVVVGNDVTAAILGEHRVGAGRPYRNLLGVFVGTGVGGGLIVGGKLWHGAGSAGEIGHAVVQPGGRECGCGRKGCLEAYAGRGRMELTARHLVKKGHKTVLFDIMKEKGRDRLTSGVIATALKRGDEVTEGLIGDAVWALGVALASVQNVLDLEAIIIGGGLGDRLGEQFVERVGKAMHPHLFRDDHPPVLLTTELGDLSGAVGAALLVADSLRSARRKAPAALSAGT